MLKETTKNAILELQKKYPFKRSALIPALHLAQNDYGYLPIEIQQEVATLFELDLNEVHSVVTFYDMFHERPVGKHLLHVCKNVSCMLRGSDELIDALCKKIGAAPHDKSPDDKFTVIPSECLGACDRAPMMIAGEKAIGPVAIDDIDSILKEVDHG